MLIAFVPVATETWTIVQQDDQKMTNEEVENM